MFASTKEHKTNISSLASTHLTRVNNSTLLRVCNNSDNINLSIFISVRIVNMVMSLFVSSTFTVQALDRSGFHSHCLGRWNVMCFHSGKYRLIVEKFLMDLGTNIVITYKKYLIFKICLFICCCFFKKLHYSEVLYYENSSRG